MAVEAIIIMKYDVPVIGIYEVDESFVVYLNGKEFGYAKSIDDAKDKIRSSVADKIKTTKEDLDSTIAQLNQINVGLIDERYRVKAFN